jgi:hypothetical protein
MKRNKDEAENLLKYTKAKLTDNEKIIVFGYAILTGWHGPKRCFISMTNFRIMILWLEERYSEIKDIQEIPITSINSFSYKYNVIAVLLAFYPIDQKPFTPRLNIEQRNLESWAFAFDDQNTAKNILVELERRLTSSSIEL